MPASRLPLRPLRQVAVLALAGFALSACVVGPDYNGPPAVAPGAVSAPAFHRAEDLPASPPPSRWWTALGDSELDQLVDEALAASPDLDIARARLQQSRAGLKQQRAGLLPNTQASALYLRTKGLTEAFGGSTGAAAGASVTGQTVGASDTLTLYDVGFDATWELDLFGGQRRTIEGAKAEANAAEANLHDAEVSLAAEVAQAYVSLRDLQQRVALAQRNVEIESRMLALTQQRRAGGSATDLDIERLNGQLKSTQADAVPLKAQIAEQLDRLAILTGQPPGALDQTLGAASRVPAPPAEVAVGDPAALLRRRPDIRAAERMIVQKNALIGQHTADLFPKVELLGSLGYGSTDLSNLLTGENLSYVAAPVLQWRPFDFGRIKAQIDEAKGERAEAIANYRKTVLGALDDAETALARFSRQKESLASLAAVKASADRASALTARRVEGGTATTLDQLDVERRRVTAETGLSQARAGLTQDFIALQKSLGLGWKG
ncbi:efflux transporter outer membrane subunit [Caulobacter sp. S45]|uniref:efflux transporter outer membrane subunit n=1 Tax=Caulobacter sp. S45 TaxID=1641861 RepID=UPI00131ECCF2|nr:efflux transporter outer membrane subunit [Caulobacter sp. S45]